MFMLQEIRQMQLKSHSELCQSVFCKRCSIAKYKQFTILCRFTSLKLDDVGTLVIHCFPQLGMELFFWTKYLKALFSK